MAENTGNELLNPLSISDLLDGGAQFEINRDFENDDDYQPEFFMNDDYGSDDDEENMKKMYTPWDRSFQELRELMVPLSGLNLIYKRTTREGVGEVIPPTARVTIDYNSYFENEVVAFDSTTMRGKHLSFHLGDSTVIEGLQMAVASMKVSEEAQFIISYSLLYRELGCLPRIKQKADALFLIKLIKFCETGDAEAVEKLSEEEKKNFSVIQSKVEELRKHAKDCFNRKNYGSAITAYLKAIRYLELCQIKDEAEQDLQSKLLESFYTSLAVCYNQRNMPAKVCLMIRDIKRLTNIDINKNCKALFQEGRALLRLGDYKGSKTCLMKAQALKPQDKSIKDELQLLNTKYDNSVKEEKNIWRKAFGLNAQLEDKTEDIAFINIIKKNIDDFMKSKDERKLPLPEGLTEHEVSAIEDLIKGMADLKINLFQSNNKKFYCLEKK